MPLFLVCGGFNFRKWEHPVAGASAGDGGVGFSDPEPAQVVFRGIEYGVAEDARVYWMVKVLANYAVAASFDLFKMWLSYCGVDLYCVVGVVFMTLCAETSP